jgi:hypothetical protein
MMKDKPSDEKCQYNNLLTVKLPIYVRQVR